MQHAFVVAILKDATPTTDLEFIDLIEDHAKVTPEQAARSNKWCRLHIKCQKQKELFGQDFSLTCELME